MVSVWERVLVNNKSIKFSEIAAGSLSRDGDFLTNDKEFDFYRV